jgi:transcriptional regulator with XRE-family HTH domain
MENNIFLKQLGVKIKTARKSRKISLPMLSKLCKTDMSNLWFIEQGQRNLHILTLKSIANVFKMDVKDFL